MPALILFVCNDCKKEQNRYISSFNQKIQCKFCKSENMKKLLKSPSSHSIITVQGNEKAVEVHANWEEMRNAISKKPEN